MSDQTPVSTKIIPRISHATQDADYQCNLCRQWGASFIVDGRSHYCWVCAQILINPRGSFHGWWLPWDHDCKE